MVSGWYLLEGERRQSTEHATYRGTQPALDSWEGAVGVARLLLKSHTQFGASSLRATLILGHRGTENSTPPGTYVESVQFKEDLFTTQQ